MGIQFLIKFYPRASQWEDKFYEFLFVIIAGERRIKGRSENYVLSFSVVFVYIRRTIYTISSNESKSYIIVYLLL